MRKLRDILRLRLDAGLSVRQIKASLRLSVGGVQKVRSIQHRPIFKEPDCTDGQCSPERKSLGLAMKTVGFVEVVEQLGSFFQDSDTAKPQAGPEDGQNEELGQFGGFSAPFTS